MADQLQTNYASDLRSILKTLFEVMATKSEQGDNETQNKGEWAWVFKALPGLCALYHWSDLLTDLFIAGPRVGSAGLEDCALCQETMTSSELAAKARDGQFEGQQCVLIPSIFCIEEDITVEYKSLNTIRNHFI